jgi:hypothetical protein
MKKRKLGFTVFNKQTVNVYTGRRRGCFGGCATIIGWLVIILIAIFIIAMLVH